MTEAFTFKFHNLTLRAVKDAEGNPWFHGADVCAALGFKAKASNILRQLDATEKGESSTPFPGQRGSAPTIISESGLYKLVMRAQRSNPKAREFQDWVTREVLPPIRKDGAYVYGEEKVRTGEMTEDQLILRAMEALDETERLKSFHPFPARTAQAIFSQAR